MTGDKVLIATRSFGSTSRKPWEVLERAGCELRRADMSAKITETHLSALLRGVSGAIIGVVPMTARVLENAPDLKVISAHGVGVDHIDLDAARRLEIAVTNCPGGNAASVADLTVGLMIAAAREIPRGDATVRGGGWGRYQGSELWNKTIGLIGLGRIGLLVAKRALGFDMQILAYDPFLKSAPAEMPQVVLSPLKEVIRRSDFVSLHPPLTAGTRHMIAAPQLAAMKPHAILINTARGGLVDEDALYTALKERQIAGAALDVFADEPPEGSPLMALDNLVVTPHIGAHTRESIERVGVMAAENVVACLRGGQPHGRVC